jgi:hypothetical protein
MKQFFGYIRQIVDRIRSQFYAFTSKSGGEGNVN